MVFDLRYLLFKGECLMSVLVKKETYVHPWAEPGTVGNKDYRGAISFASKRLPVVPGGVISEDTTEARRFMNFVSEFVEADDRFKYWSEKKDCRGCIADRKERSLKEAVIEAEQAVENMKGYVDKYVRKIPTALVSEIYVGSLGGEMLKSNPGPCTERLSAGSVEAFGGDDGKMPSQSVAALTNCGSVGSVEDLLTLRSL
jgi:hypothetical protein